MPINKGFEAIGDLIKEERRPRKPPAYQWQELALRIIRELGIPAYKKNSVFKVCKIYPKAFVEKCFNDTKELCRTGEKWRYFFKLFSSHK